MALDTSRAAASQLEPQFLAREQAVDRRRQGGGVIRRDEQARLLVNNELRNSSYGCGHDGNSTRHRLEDRDREVVATGGKHEDIEAADTLSEVVNEAVEGRGDTKLSRQVLELRAGRPIAEDLQGNWLRAGGCGSQQHVDPLVVIERCGRSDRGRLPSRRRR